MGLCVGRVWWLAERRAGAAHCFVQNEQTLFLYGGEAPNHGLLADTWRFGCARACLETSPASPRLPAKSSGKPQCILRAQGPRQRRLWPSARVRGVCGEAEEGIRRSVPGKRDHSRAILA